jgi:hypothetical protein
MRFTNIEFIVTTTARLTRCYRLRQAFQPIDSAPRESQRVDMYNAGEGNQFEEIAIPAGDPGEQLVASLILSIIVCQMYTLPKAVPYIAKAYELAMRLESQTITYRPPSPSKFARMEFELRGTTEIVLFPLINNVLVMPTAGPADLPRIASTASVQMNLTSLNVAHFILRLQTRRLVAALSNLKTVESPEELVEAAHRLLAKCFYREIKSCEPIDRADDLFILSRAFIAKRSFEMAAIALKNADSELEVYLKSTSMREHLPRMQEMREQIAAMIKNLTSGAT